MVTERIPFVQTASAQFPNPPFVQMAFAQILISSCTAQNARKVTFFFSNMQIPVSILEKKDLIFILTDSTTLIATKCNHKIGIIWVIQKKAVSLHRFFIQRCHKYGIYRKVNSDNSITIFEY